MGQVDYTLDVRRAAKDAGMTYRQYARAVGISFETLRGILYQGRLTSVPTLYHMAARSRRFYIDGPEGPMVLVPLSYLTGDRTPPPASPGAAKTMPRKDVA